MKVSKSNENVLQKSVLVLLLMATPAFAWSQQNKPSAPAPKPAAGASAQVVSLQEQLAAKYKLAKIGSDSSGYSVVQEGTLLAVEKAGILGVAYKNLTLRSSTYQDGTVHASDLPTGRLEWGKTLCGVLKKCPSTPDAVKNETTTHLFQVGDKVYPTKLDVNVDKDQVTMGIVACDTCNKTDPPTYNKAQVVFRFSKGSLATAGASGVEDMIGQLLSVSSDDQKAQSGQRVQQTAQQDVQDQQPAADAATVAAPATIAQAEPQSIEQGMTPDQVEVALGKPDRKVTVGTKQLYIYKDMKVTFKDGKVSDVE
jgi:hypothetical protein